MVENEPERGTQELKLLYPKGGKAYILGVTGPPGSGKSTLIAQLTTHFRQARKKVGIVTIDPTSPYSGGAILGDRLRMQQHSTDPGVFIRSMATRGSLGGLSRTTDEVITILDASGMEIILIETVGAGQDEVDIMQMVHTSIVVLVPDSGDEIQTIKAGIMEIGDLFVVNKADRDDADRKVKEIEWMLNSTPPKVENWKPRVFKTTAPRGEGIDGLMEGISQHQALVAKQNYLESKSKLWSEIKLKRILGEKILKYIFDNYLSQGEFDKYIKEISTRNTDPYTVAEEIIARLR